MYLFLILIFLSGLVASGLAHEVSTSWPASPQGSRLRNNASQADPTLPAKPKPTHNGGDDGSQSSSCRFLTEGFGPLPDEDTPEAFRQFQLLWDISAQAVEPNGYSCTLSNLDGAIEPGAGYLGLEFLEQYNTTRCAELCEDRPRCGSFNICQCNVIKSTIPEPLKLTRRRLRARPIVRPESQTRLSESCLDEQYQMCFVAVIANKGGPSQPWRDSSGLRSGDCGLKCV